MLILGGDLRLLKVASEFKDEGFILSVYGIDPKYFETPYNTYNDYVSAVSDNDIIIMGLPASKDNTTINTPYFNDRQIVLLENPFCCLGFRVFYAF